MLDEHFGIGVVEYMVKCERRIGHDGRFEHALGRKVQLMANLNFSSFLFQL